jgi:hypothetical protein
MKSIVGCMLVLSVLTLSVGCATKNHWFTSGMIDNAVSAKKAEGWVAPAHAPDKLGRPLMLDGQIVPGRVEMSYTPEQIAAEMYPFRYPILRGLEWTFDGGAVVAGVATVAGGVVTIADAINGNNGDETTTYNIEAGRDVNIGDGGQQNDNTDNHTEGGAE